MTPPPNGLHRFLTAVAVCAAVLLAAVLWWLVGNLGG